MKCSWLERICSIWGTKAATASAAASHSILKSLLRNFLDGIASPDTSEWLVYYLNNFHTIFWVGKQINLALLYIPEIWHQETHQSVILLSKWTQPDISKALRPILSGVFYYEEKLTIFEYLIGWFVVVAKSLAKYISNSRQICTFQNWDKYYPSSTWSGDLWLWLRGVAAFEGRALHVGRDPMWCKHRLLINSARCGSVYPYISVYIYIPWHNIGITCCILPSSGYNSICVQFGKFVTHRNVGHLQIAPMSRWWSPLLIVLLLFQTWDASFRLKGSGWAASAIRATMVQQGGDFTRRPVHKCARPAHNGPSATRPPTPQMERGCSTGSSLRWRWSTLMPRCRSCRGGRMGGSCHLSLIINQTKRYLHCPTLRYIVSPPTETKLNKDCAHHCRAEFHQCNSCHLSNYQSKHTYLHCWHKGNWALQRYKVHATQWISLFCTVMLVQSWSFALVVQGSMCKCAVKAEMWFVFICSQQRKTWQTNLLEQANSWL